MTISDRVPQAAPGAMYAARRDEIDEATRRVFERGSYILGAEVEAFEAEFASYIGARHAVGVANGTDALELALRALEVGRGQAVFTVAHTAVATVCAIERAGAVPVLVDVDEETFTMDPEKLAAAVRGFHSRRDLRPAAIVVVHLYGQMADMPAILAVSRAAGLKVVEDCAQAHGARLAGRIAGTWADAAAFSFYPTKNLGAFGDAGLVATNDERTASVVRQLRQYGWSENRVSLLAGLNSRLDELQAAILRVGLRHLDADNLRRGAIARIYDGLQTHGPITPKLLDGAHHVYHQYVIRISERDRLRSELAAQNIGTAIHYPRAVHQQPAYRRLADATTDLKGTENVVSQIVSLPMFPALSDEAAMRVFEAIKDWAAKSGAVASR
jgi:dTDP-4-amino-4,6-dideoxygalactose transaminase